IGFSADRDTITTAAGDVALVTYEIVDSAGIVVPTATNIVRFTTKGGSIVALDNADLRDLDPYRTDQRHAFNGRGLAILRAPSPGPLRVTAGADGLGTSSLTVQVRRGVETPTIPGVSRK